MDAKKSAKIAVTIASVLFALALIADIVIFYKQFLSVILWAFIALFVFMILGYAFVLSIVLVFGFRLAEKYGFWPFKIVGDLLKNMFSTFSSIEYPHTAFVITKIIAIVVSIAVIVIASISLHHNRIECGGDKIKMMNKNKHFANFAIIISSVLIFFAIALFLITSI